MKKRIISLLLAAVLLVTLLPRLPQEANAYEIVMTAEEFIDCLWTAYNRPNKYRNEFPYNLGYYDGNVIYFDCWNLGKAIIWTKGAIVNNYTVGYHATIDASCGLGDWDGLAIVQAAPNCSSDFTNLVPGEWLYMENHTGYYVGNGQVIECTVGWGVNCVTISQIDQYGNRSRNGVPRGTWELHGMVPWLDYEADKDRWEQDSNGWWYEYADGSYAIGWAMIDGYWYYFNQSGYMHTGWLFDEGHQSWFYLDSVTGRMQTGWTMIDGYYYYLDPNGKMLTGWQKIDQDWFYLNTTDGAMLTGWQKIDGEWYYFNELSDGTKGAMKTGWVNVEGKWYYLNANGVMQRGWQLIDGKWYHLDEESGVMSSKVWIYDDGVWYYVNASGAMTEGAEWHGTFENGLDIGTGFYATIDIPYTGTRAGVDSDPNSATYQNVEVQAVRAEDASDYNEQLWYFERRDEDGSYRITNVATGMVMDQVGGYVDKGTSVRVCPNYDSLAQRWFVFANGDHYGFVTACSAWDMTVLDVANGLGDEGTDIRIWPHNGYAAQQFTVTPIHTEHNYVCGVCTECGAEDPDYVPVTVTGKSFSLSFEDEVLVNFYYAVSDLTDVTEHGMLVFYTKPETVDLSLADDVYTDSVYVESLGCYMNTTKGIAAKKMGDTRYYVAYAKLLDGSCIYSAAYDYSPKKYSMNMLGRDTTSAKQKALCVAMLNYGAAAQEYFGYRTEDLMNRDLTDAQKALVMAYDKTLFTGSVAADAAKTGAFPRTEGFHSKSVTVSFEGAFAINYYFVPSAEVAGDMTFYLWTPEAYASAAQLTAHNASKVITMKAQENGAYWAQLSGIAAKMLDETYYVAGVYTDAEGNTHCTGVIAYSLSRYCMNNVNGNMSKLAQTTDMYGYYAETYFA